MVKSGLLWLAVSLLLFQSACGFKDIDNRFFVIIVGIDEGKEHLYKVSLMLAIPSPRTEPGVAKSVVITKEADTIAEAVRLMKSNVDKEFDFGQTKVFVIGKSFAEHQDLSDTLDWMFRRRDIQQISLLAVGSPDAESVLKTNPKSQRIPGNDLILALSGSGTQSPYILREYLFDFYRRIHSHGIDAYLPIIEPEEDNLVINRALVLKDTRGRLELSSEETATLNQLVHGFRRFIIKARIDGQNVTFSASKLSIRYRFSYPPSAPPEIRLHASVVADLEDTPISFFHKDWSKLERMIAERLESQYGDLLRKLQKQGVDPVGFGIRYRAVTHKGDAEIEQWKELYPEIKFRVTVKADFKSTGIIE